jgi:hypothetical protein
MTTILKFIEDLPPRNGSSLQTPWAPVVSALKENPGRWALIEEGVDLQRSKAIRMSLQRYGAEVTQRTSGDAIDVYAKMP